jgi:hypothetical protein
MPELLAESGHQVGGVFWVARLNEMVIVGGRAFSISSHLRGELVAEQERPTRPVFKNGLCCRAREKYSND